MTTKKKPSKPTRVDWEAVERDYRTGRLTNIELGRKHGFDPATLSRKIKQDKIKDSGRWARDLTEVVRQATDARVLAEMVKAEIKAEVKEGQAEVKETVKAAAEVNAQVILKHRDRVNKASGVAMRMLEELDATTLKTDEIEALFAEATTDVAGPAKNLLVQQFKDFMRLHTRVASAQKLMAALKDAQTLEAQTFGLYDGKKAPGGEAEQLTDEELDAAIAEKQARLR